MRNYTRQYFILADDMGPVAFDWAPDAAAAEAIRDNLGNLFPSATVTVTQYWILLNLYNVTNLIKLTGSTPSGPISGMLVTPGQGANPEKDWNAKNKLFQNETKFSATGKEGGKPKEPDFGGATNLFNAFVAICNNLIKTLAARGDKKGLNTVELALKEVLGGTLAITDALAIFVRAGLI